MYKRILISLLFCALGAFISHWGYQQWRLDPLRSYHPVTCTVIDHVVALDEMRWKERYRDALRVDTQVVMSSGYRRELTVPAFFSRDNDAWKFINANPDGTEKRCLVSEKGDVAVWDHYSPSRPMVFIIGGSFVFLSSLAWFFCSHRIRIPDAWLAALAGGIFLIMGLYFASHQWPEAIRHIQAARWELTSYTSLGHRIISSRGSGRSGRLRDQRDQEAIQYAFGGKTYVSIRPGNSFPDAPHHACRVNPDHPWQVALSWGWRPGLGSVLVPIPFMTLGLFVLFATFSSSFQKLMKDTQRLRSSTRNHTSKKVPLALWESGFLLLFLGPIVGIFVVVCAEMWLDGHFEKWFLTILLVPGVIGIFFLLRAFVREVRRMRSERSRG